MMRDTFEPEEVVIAGIAGRRGDEAGPGQQLLQGPAGGMAECDRHLALGPALAQGNDELQQAEIGFHQGRGVEREGSRCTEARDKYFAQFGCRPQGYGSWEVKNSSAGN